MQDTCRLCRQSCSLIYDFGEMPIANNLLSSPDAPDPHYPLRFLQCDSCDLLQVNTLPKDAIFHADYPYFSSINRSYIEQCRIFAEQIKKTASYHHSVLEIGANDGYLLQFLKDDFECLAIEPCKSVAVECEKKGIKTITNFFTEALADSLKFDDMYDHIIINNVIGHVPDLNDFMRGLVKICYYDAKVYVEMPDAEILIRDCLFDTIYHEHYTYFTKETMTYLFAQYGFSLLGTENLLSHGGSIRYTFQYDSKLMGFLQKPHKIDANKFESDLNFKVGSMKAQITEYEFFNKKVVLYGAAAKGISFLNVCGFTDKDFIACIDDTPAKQGKFLPGSHIPILPSIALDSLKPDVIFVLPWNHLSEIKSKLKFSEKWGCEIVP